MGALDLEQKKQKRIFRISLALSLLFNLSILFLWRFEIQSELKKLVENQPKERKIQILLKKPRKTKDKQIVNHVESKLDKKVPTRFLSKKDNWFRKQMTAKKTGKFQNRKKSKQVPDAKKQLAKKQNRPKNKNIKLKDLSLKTLKKLGQMAALKQVKPNRPQGRSGASVSANNDHVEDLPLGDMTQYNTQEYKFYGFYFRIRQRLEQFWGISVQDKIRRLYKSGRKLVNGRKMITNIEIILNSRGTIEAVKIINTSGYHELDDAAVESFNQAGPFPNPPKGMLRNGRALIKWGFVVKS